MKSLVKRAQRGDDQAFVELIEENKQATYKVVVGIIKTIFFPSKSSITLTFRFIILYHHSSSNYNIKLNNYNALR